MTTKLILFFFFNKNGLEDFNFLSNQTKSEIKF